MTHRGARLTEVFALTHMEVIFGEAGIKYQRAVVSEGRSKPDFLFPGRREYCDPGYEALLLTMLGVKSTCKDRWRQVLAEAKRIENKHLLTLETAISQNQTEQMKEARLQLVVPQRLHQTYTPQQQEWLLNVSEFTDLVRERQIKAGTV